MKLASERRLKFESLKSPHGIFRVDTMKLASERRLKFIGIILVATGLIRHNEISFRKKIEMFSIVFFHPFVELGHNEISFRKKIEIRNVSMYCFYSKIQTQ